MTLRVPESPRRSKQIQQPPSLRRSKRVFLSSRLHRGRVLRRSARPGRHFEDTRVARLYEGTDEILTLKIAAAVLGKDYEAFQ